MIPKLKSKLKKVVKSCSLVLMATVISTVTLLPNVNAVGNSAQDIRLKSELDNLVKGVSDDATRFNLIKDHLQNAVDSWYTVPAATSASTVKPYSVKLKSLKCFTTEDSTGADECSLDVYVDGSKVKTFKKDLNDGNSYTLNTTYTYNSSFSLKLYDRDSPGFPLYDDNDWLGTVTIKNDTGNGYSAAFNRDGALYIINYDVNFSYTPQVTKEQQKALVMNDYLNYYINKSSSNGVSKYSLFNDINATVKDPIRQVNQQTTPTCGTSATILELARKFPKKFVLSCWEVYATNKLKGYDNKTYTFDANAAKDYLSKLSASDWILTGIVNPSFNGTNNSKLEGIIKALLPFKTVGTTTTYLWGEESAIKKASNIVNNGGIAFLKINSKMINEEYSTSGSWIWQSSDHIIVMQGSLKINSGSWYAWDSGHYTFNYWTWAKGGNMMYASEGRFEDGFLGVTYAY